LICLFSVFVYLQLSAGLFLFNAYLTLLAGCGTILGDPGLVFFVFFCLFLSFVFFCFFLYFSVFFCLFLSFFDPLGPLERHRGAAWTAENPEGFNGDGHGGAWGSFEQGFWLKPNWLSTAL
jgi:hypothetical protein